ncbi:DHH family phosphoesterase [Thermodesulfomicrobium sp. WS]|uniref:DHH family phosphoesterase n=1 Tax=Thermodesulfomicrobium sp. WS TaxID=3004129 RepID=UPI0024915FEF|nr:phosphoesterase [Thermodesulfomicrobium sp. WS]BDV00251.1 DHH family phosphoesterase [Thermodesulfomicrobium sp. WS]
MAYFRKLGPKLEKLLDLLDKNERWLIVIVADPDAMASAMALKRIMAGRVREVGIAHVNEISRPDNLAMMRLLRIPTKKYTPLLRAQYDRFALVDSQPHHNTQLAEIPFSLVIDHHPKAADVPVQADFVEIVSEYGANSTIMTEYLYNLDIRPGKLLATALLYGIKTDTQSFERDFHDIDMRAFRYLAKFYHRPLLHKIIRSEFKLEWLTYFAQAFRKIRVFGKAIFIFMGKVESSDILVILADFFLRVHGVSATIVSGIFQDRLIVVFRGDGLRQDMGKYAQRLFGEFGSAGGHRTMARAEIPLANVSDQHVSQFVWDRLQACAWKRKEDGPCR